MGALGVLVSGVGVLVSGVGVLESGVGVVLVWPDEVLTLRLGAKLEITLCAAPPHPAVRHPIRMAIKRKRP